MVVLLCLVPTRYITLVQYEIVILTIVYTCKKDLNKAQYNRTCAGLDNNTYSTIILQNRQRLGNFITSILLGIINILYSETMEGFQRWAHRQYEYLLKILNFSQNK